MLKYVLSMPSASISVLVAQHWAPELLSPAKRRTTSTGHLQALPGVDDGAQVVGPCVHKLVELALRCVRVGSTRNVDANRAPDLVQPFDNFVRGVAAWPPSMLLTVEVPGIGISSC